MALFHADTFGQGMVPPKRPHRPRSGKCLTTGCPNEADRRGRCPRCYYHLYNRFGGPFWPDDIELEWTPVCCFKECGRPASEATRDFDFPACPEHERCLYWAISLEEGGFRVPLRLLDCEEWLAARFFHEVQKSAKSAEDRRLFDLIYGDTPLTKMFLQLLERYAKVLENIL